MSIDSSAIQLIADLGASAVDDLEPGKIYAVSAAGRTQQIDLTGDQYRDYPKRKKGTVVVRDVPSFLAYHAKHSDANTEVYADRAARSITAVLDAHQATGAVDQNESGARWGQHRLVLQLTHTESFLAWTAASTKPMTQLAFAEFVEDHRADITNPAAADLLELAQSFEATTKVTFRSGTRLKSGQRALTYVEEQNATGGSGEVTIPDSFDLAVPIFEGATVADALTARLRYRINEGKLIMLYVLDEVTKAVDSAFEGVVADVDQGVTVPILRGVPA